MSFDENQIKLLKEPLLKENVKTREGIGDTELSYLASFHVIEEANNIFGFGGWDSEIITLKQVDKTEYEKPPYKAGDNPKEMISISYMCTLRVTVKCEGGTVIREDVGFGNGVAGATAYGIGSCIELASKESVTDALKRCLRYFGNKFGLTLYDKDVDVLSSDQFEMSKPVSSEQLDKLRALYDARGIDDEWVMLALKAENYTGSFEEMRYDWYSLAYDIVYKYKLDEIEAENYKLDIEKVIKLMKASANMNMLKSLFREAWTKATAQNDKDKQLECQKLYEELKGKLEK